MTPRTKPSQPAPEVDKKHSLQLFATDAGQPASTAATPAADRDPDCFQLHNDYKIVEAVGRKATATGAVDCDDNDGRNQSSRSAH